MNATRRRIIDLLRTRGRLTISDLTQHTRMTRTAVVRHVAALEREGIVARAGLRPAKRRPSMTYTLTELADALFTQAYDAFAIALMDEIKRAGKDVLGAATSRIPQRCIDRDMPPLQRYRGSERLRRATAILAEHGFMPKLQQRGGRFVLRHYNCPIKRVGAKHPEVCEMVTRWIQALVGVPLRQTQCACRGAAFCMYVPTPAQI